MIDSDNRFDNFAEVRTFDAPVSLKPSKAELRERDRLGWELRAKRTDAKPALRCLFESTQTQVNMATNGALNDVWENE